MSSSEPPSDFLPGIELSRYCYREFLAPVFGGHPHAAALLGPGSEVLGFDTNRSTDHDWGPRLQVFVTDESGELAARAERALPREVRGHPRLPGALEVTGLATWFGARLGFDPAELTTFDWLATPAQLLAEVTGGAVFHDGTGELTAARTRLSWYPDQVWRYILACQWQKISEEEAFPGRCAETGDELGASVVAARLARELMRLCFLLERRYPPYSKWLGNAFARLELARELAPVLHSATGARDAGERERALASAYGRLATAQNALELTEPVDTAIRPYHARPYRVLHAERFADALLAGITDPQLRGLSRAGAIDQYADDPKVLVPQGSGHTARAIAAAVHPGLSGSR
ncbi:DUF4037 domain-containing protein [Sciscionella sediminilitoris]|uniref:DUF4037 domain-containing protein n=1 Tax=Sciscionella sediminilitoris TaxID=1445613 RepID=UPI0004DF43C5|nr:DUF4037 domain-containing protein [Sciscionella sp. SE31]